ncbi:MULTISPECIES: ECF transporter S component [Eubacteriales]|uniref:ECF transporter S component n=1 Tax=Bittarella massiliensis (ex Durand et al. 2017) TaxID=1720313 RepID=A0AAP1LGJ5_9FIRM|nr:MULTISPECIES: ECF transporter S component [Eubacteriales]ERI96653.1 hypothetical protein HMPREF0262_03483 [Clostridium sp. ATCC 29733]MBC2870959.1 ECF transporter S component [Bittarella massiliensis (ex Durand et al. 2017)]MCQ4948485.1 ECF transporter S component [Bittarella massiliensis (ex Durand et al. 2017)]MZL70672.1 ECF transporter S component [Bittarella massiliensis (ex Durand et al. 2017)]MZL81330.1 ECF transporter S component [Bittarella massiliensis (ex Durand et al. 2017)]
MKRKSSIYTVTLVGLMGAMCFVATFLHIDIPTPLGKTMIHLGNVMCLLSGMILGPLKGGLSAGLGSAVYDLFDPAYIAESPITFLMKFAMGATCGAIAKRGGKGSRAAGAVVGAGLYVVLYTVKNILMGTLLQGKMLDSVLVAAGTKALTSGVNAIIAVVVSLLLYSLLEPILKKAGIFERLGKTGD